MKSRGKHAIEGSREKKWKTSRIVYMCIAIVYFLVVVGATAYSLTAYQDTLPRVELIQATRGRVPAQCLMPAPNDGLLLNTVERQDGPWGRRYVVKQINVYSYQKMDNGEMFVYDIISNENPIVLSTTADFLYDGMEVRIS